MATQTKVSGSLTIRADYMDIFSASFDLAVPPGVDPCIFLRKAMIRELERLSAHAEQFPQLSALPAPQVIE